MSQFRAAIEASLDHAEMMNNLCEANFEIKVDKLTSVIPISFYYAYFVLAYIGLHVPIICVKKIRSFTCVRIINQ